MNMKSESEEESQMDIPDEIEQEAASVTTNNLPPKSKNQYERAYKLFMDWNRESKTNALSENILLAYFEQLSSRIKPSSLWAVYSMLRMTINIKNNVDISKYSKLCELLKSKSSGYKPKKSKTLTPEQIREFLSCAADDKHLFTKVGLIFGMMGHCRREELMKIETTHVEDLGTALLVRIPNAATKCERHFVIRGYFYNICKKYMELRPPHLVNVKRFFLNYQRGKCTIQPVGINKFGSLANQVATFLKLPNPTSYTGHCLRRSSATVLIEPEANITAVKRRRRCCPTSVPEGYIDNSLNNTTDKKLHSAEGSDNENIKLEISEDTDISDNNTENLDFDISDSTDVKVEVCEHTQGSDSGSNHVTVNETQFDDNNWRPSVTVTVNSDTDSTAVKHHEGSCSTSGPEKAKSSDKNTENINFQTGESADIKFEVGESTEGSNSSSNQITVNRTQIDDKKIGKLMISFNNCQNITNLTVNVYLPK